MANKCYSIDCTDSSSFSRTMAAAITDRYGSSAVIQNTDGTIHVKLPFDNDHLFGFLKSGAWFTGFADYANGTGSNWRYIVSSKNISGPNGPASAMVVFGDSFVLYNAFMTAKSLSVSSLIAKTEGGKLLVFGGGSTSSYSLGLSLDVTNNRYFKILSFGRSFDCGVNIPYKTKPLFIYTDGNGDRLMRKNNGELDTVKNLAMSTRNGSAATSRAMFSYNNLYSNTGVSLTTSLLAEF